MEHNTTVMDTAIGAPVGDADNLVDNVVGNLVEEEMLIEEISIDGMCGVY